MSYFHPERMPELPARRRAAARHQLVAVAGSSRRTRGKGKKTAMTAGAAALVLATGAAAFAVAEFQPVTDRSQARCYSVADASSEFVAIGEASRPASTADVQNAVRVCASLFRQGLLQAGVAGVVTSANTAVRHPVPALVACTMSSGIAAVFPGGHRTCAQLGLSSASGGP